MQVGLDIAIHDAVRKKAALARRMGPRFNGEFLVRRMDYDAAYVFDHDYYWIATTSPTEELVAPANPCSFEFDLHVGASQVNYNGALDPLLFQTAAHPFFWPVPYYIPKGTRVSFNTNEDDQWIGPEIALHGFIPVEPRADKATTRRPFIYVAQFDQMGDNSEGRVTFKVIPETNFVITRMLAIQRFIDLQRATNVPVDISFVTQLWVKSNPYVLRNTQASSVYGTRVYPLELDTPIKVSGGDTVEVSVNTPFYGIEANYVNIKIFFVGVQTGVTGSLNPSIPV